ncbi:MAG: caspase family protein [Ignavibacteriaceae bacterium]|nr:caspase family protein [Ignavibacteriaceae bacterium]
MNKRYCICQFLCLLLLFISITSAQEPVKRALIAGISEFKYFPYINGENDIRLISEALAEQKFTDIRVLAGKQATKHNLMAAFDTLINDTGPGDIIVLHFSTHGQQIYDISGDEPDGLDEAMVMYDSYPEFRDGYTGQNHFSDDEFEIVLERLREKSGKNGIVTVFLDACYSATATRGEEIARGGEPPLVPKDFVLRNDPDKDIYTGKRPLKTGEAPLCVFAASRSNQKNFEYAGNGSLTYALASALREITPGVTNRGLFNMIQNRFSVISPSQIPVAEGNGLDNEVFAGNIIPPQPFFLITDYDTTTGIVTINSGKIAGLYTGSEVSVYPAGTIDTAGIYPLLTAVTDSAVLTASYCTIDAKTDAVINKGLPVFVKKYAELPFIIPVAFGPFSDNRLRESLGDLVKTFSTLKPAGNGVSPELVIREGNDGRVDLNIASSGMNFREGLAGEVEVKKAIQKYAQSKLLRELMVKDPKINLDISFIPVKNYNPINKTFIDTGDISAFYLNGLLSVTPNDTFLIRIRNTGKSPAYFNLIDIQPDGIVSLLVPKPERNEDPSAFRIFPGNEYILPKPYRFKAPYGAEIFKLIATKEPLDLRFVMLSLRGEEADRKAEKTRLELLFENSFDLSTRSERRNAASNLSGISVTDFKFEIREK